MATREAQHHCTCQDTMQDLKWFPSACQIHYSAQISTFSMRLLHRPLQTPPRPHCDYETAQISPLLVGHYCRTSKQSVTFLLDGVSWLILKPDSAFCWLCVLQRMSSGRGGPDYNQSQNQVQRQVVVLHCRLVCLKSISVFGIHYHHHIRLLNNRQNAVAQTKMRGEEIT